MTQDYADRIAITFTMVVALIAMTAFFAIWVVDKIHVIESKLDKLSGDSKDDAN